MKVIDYANREHHFVFYIRDKTIALKKEVLKKNTDNVLKKIGIGVLLGAAMFILVGVSN